MSAEQRHQPSVQRDDEGDGRAQKGGVARAPPTLSLLVCTLCDHPICDASDILGDKADINPEYGFAYKFDGMLNICDPSSDEEEENSDETVGGSASARPSEPQRLEAPYCYRIQHKSIASLNRCNRGTARQAERALDEMTLSLGEGLVAKISQGEQGVPKLNDLLMPERMSEVCSDQRVDVVRVMERVGDFGVRHEVFSTQTEYALSSMELPDEATLNDGSIVPSFVLSEAAAAAVPDGSSADSPGAIQTSQAPLTGGVYFALQLENVLSSTVEWFPGFAVHNEAHCASCGAPVGYRFVSKPPTHPTNLPTTTPNPTTDGFIGIFLSAVKQREWGVRQFARRTVLAKIHSLFDALTASRESADNWRMMDSLAELALAQLEVRARGVGPSRSAFVETMPTSLRTIMGRLALSLPVDVPNADPAGSHRHARFLSQAEEPLQGNGSNGGETTIGLDAQTAAAAIRGQQRLRTQVVADSMQHFMRIAREPLLFSNMLADFVVNGGLEAREERDAEAAAEGPLIAGILQDTQRQSETIDRLNTFRSVPTGRESAPFLLATAAQMMESIRKITVDNAVKERVAGYKQQAKLIQQLVDKLREQNTVLVDLVASQRSKMRGNDTQMKMYESIIEAHKAQLSTYDKHIKYQEELVKTLRDQIACSSSEIAEQQKIVRNQNETIKSQNGTIKAQSEQMALMKKLYSEVLMRMDSERDDRQKEMLRRVAASRAATAARCGTAPEAIADSSADGEGVRPDSPSFNQADDGGGVSDSAYAQRTITKEQREQEARDEAIAKAADRQERLAYLKSLLQQKETLTATLSSRAAHAPPRTSTTDDGSTLGSVNGGRSDQSNADGA